MFRSTFSKFSAQAQRACGKNMSSTGGSAPGVGGEQKWTFKRVVTFVSKNRQQFINIFAMYLVVSFGVHNFKVKKAWEEREVQVTQLNADYSALKDALLDEEWLSELEKKVRAAKPTQDVLRSELEDRFANFNPQSETNKAVKSAPAKEAVTPSVVGTEPVGITVNSRSSGKVI